MWEYELRNTKTGERVIIFGYNEIDAFKRVPQLDPKEWAVVSWSYED